MRKAGSTSQSVEVLALDYEGRPVATLTHASDGLSLNYHRPGSAAVAITPAALGSPSASWTAGGFVHVANGIYRVDVPDAAFAAGVNRVTVTGAATGVVFVPLRVALVAFDPQSATNLGLSQLGGLAVGVNVDTIKGEAVSVTGTVNFLGTVGNSTLDEAGVREAVGLAVANLDTQLGGLATVSGVWAAGTRTLTSGANIVLAKEAGITGFTDLDASGVRSAVGLASANLDAQLDAIATGGLDAGAVADAVWDATRADHGDAGTFGEVLQGSDGTADGATEDTIDLGANAPVADVTGQGVQIVAGAGAGQARRIVAYADGVATVSPAWDDEPDDTSRWVLTGIVPGGPVDLADDAITPAKLADGAITAAKIADGAITGPKIADGAFTSAKVGLGTVNAAATGFLERLRKLMDALVPVGLGGVTQPRSGAGSRVVKNPDGTTQATYPVDTEAAGGTQTLGPGA